MQAERAVEAVPETPEEGAASETLMGSSLLLFSLAVSTAVWNDPQDGQIKAGQITSHSDGLHGYIGCHAEKAPGKAGFNLGVSFYTAIWPLIDRPLANFQIGLAGTWIMPDNSDNKDKPLAPVGTYARTNWEKERGPTFDSVFQTIEGSPGYWAGNHFRYHSPKFSMNGTPQAYDYEVGSPGWGFFHDDKPLPDNRLGLAQLSNRLLIPPDGLPFKGRPKGDFLGYAWMAMPFTDPTAGDPPTGDQSWTCFLNTTNFKGPIAFYIPETWSKIGKLFDYPYIYGRGLDTRPGNIGGGFAIEINTVPRFDSRDASGTVYSKIPKLEFPIDKEGNTPLVQDVVYYGKGAIYDAFQIWSDGGETCTGVLDGRSAFKSTLATNTTRYDQEGKEMTGVTDLFDTRIFGEHTWGLTWTEAGKRAQGVFPQYFKHQGDKRVAVPESAVPVETGLREKEFPLAESGNAYTSPSTGAWGNPGPASRPFEVKLADGSRVTYRWYRFVDQPSFQQYHWNAKKKARLQSLVEKIHAKWPINRDYMRPPSQGKLVAIDPSLIVKPPKGMEVGYVPIVVRQAAL
ncbi:hypothetical protein EON81_03615 [bacterium]|nr:MAG: hypothetical protein EON81_03615 [bacterium]